NRIGMQNDINPLANFIAEGIVNLHNGNESDYEKALRSVEDRCKDRIQGIAELNDCELQNLKGNVRLPENVPLPRNADVERYHDLFSTKQLLSLSILRETIDAIPNKFARRGILLAWSATVSKLNKTFLSAEG